MFLEIIISILAILVGIVVYWRESRSNSIFRGYNAFINKKETRMKANDRKGFFFLRNPAYRVLNALLLAAIFSIIIYYVPFLRTQIIQLGLAFLVGFVVGTYIASALPTVKRAIDNPMATLQDVGEEAKNIVSDLSQSAKERILESKENVPTPSTEPKKEVAPEEPKEEKESARDRMKRKGYL